MILPSPEFPLRQRTLSLIIPVYQGGHEFRLCLEGIAKLYPPADELIVVVDGEDNGSEDAANAAGARVVKLSERKGPATARNAGVRESTGDLLLFIDADTIPAPSVVGQVRAAFDADPGLSALIGSYDDTPGADSFLSQYRNLLHHYIHQTADSHAHTFWGACGAIRREVFFAVGGFDETYGIPAMEDVELGYRIDRAGYRIHLDKALQVKHLKRWDALGMLRTDIFQRAIPWSQLLLRERRMDNDLNLRTASRLSGALAWSLLAALAATGVWPVALYPAGLAVASLLALNFPLYQFFLRVRGLRLALMAIPWHWLYYVYGSASFAYVLLTNHQQNDPAAQLVNTADQSRQHHER